VPGARIRARVAGREWETVADGAGYFELTLDTATEAEGGEAWRRVEMELLPSPPKARATARALVPPPEARFGVVSDIDDTVVRTNAANLLRMLRMVFLTNARTRLPFPGVAAFYRALQRGEAGDRTNPIFYVSSSPWNLYDLLTEVFEVHGVPTGPLFLKHLDLFAPLRAGRHHSHKLVVIDNILTTHADLPFVLIGDSGQKDPEIYREVVRRYPGRIRAVYIRDVSGGERDEEVHALAREIRSEGVEIVFTAHTSEAALHASGLGLVDAGAVEEVRAEEYAD
ncbi:MAG TPA: phosphatase domain-containing protein, partial [Longimicrobiaceae bacterium]|nr:phosphatase domain-containing protein [Longimicrobiaceae bacterium]